MPFLVLACQGESGPPLVASDVQVFLPLPEADTGVAYFTLENRSSSEIIVNKISSPQFAAVAIHETILKDGVARMRPVSQLPVGPKSRIKLEPGGIHLMLMNPAEGVRIDATVTLRVHYDEAGLMLIDTRAKPRKILITE